MSIAVHHYTLDGRQALPSAEDLLQQARDAVRDSTVYSGWYDVSQRMFSNQFEIGDNVYTYHLEPPLILLPRAAIRHSALKEWGQDLDDEEEVYCVGDLEEFQSGLSKHDRAASPTFFTSSGSDSAPQLPNERDYTDTKKYGKCGTSISRSALGKRAVSSSPSRPPKRLRNSHTAYSFPRPYSEESSLSGMYSGMDESDLNKDPGITRPESMLLPAESVKRPWPQRSSPIRMEGTNTSENKGSKSHTRGVATVDPSAPSNIMASNMALTTASAVKPHKGRWQSAESLEPSSSPASDNSNLFSTSTAMFPPNQLQLQLRQLPDHDFETRSEASSSLQSSVGPETEEEFDVQYPFPSTWVHEDSEDPSIFVRTTVRFVHQGYSSADTEPKIQLPVQDLRLHALESDRDSLSARSDEGIDNNAVNGLKTSAVAPEANSRPSAISPSCKRKSVMLSRSCNDLMDPSWAKMVQRAVANVVTKEQQVSLYSMVPSPHFYMVPEDSSMTCPPETDFTSLGRKPQPITPHDIEYVYDILARPYGRCAWIIPIRGTLPWTGAATASFTDEPSSTPPLLRSPPSQHIIWTPDAMRAFWSFLISRRASGIYGPLGLAYHTVSRKPRFTSVRGDEGKPTLNEVDHFKVYIDAGYAATMREALEEWCYHPDFSSVAAKRNSPEWDFDEGTAIDLDSGESVDIASTQEVKKDDMPQRMLQGMYLPLVDETNAGILIC